MSSLGAFLETMKIYEEEKVTKNYGKRVNILRTILIVFPKD